MSIDVDVLLSTGPEPRLVGRLLALAEKAALVKVEEAVLEFPRVAKELKLAASTMKRVQQRLEEVRRDYER